MNESYLVTYRHKGGRKTFVVEMPSIPKLLAWIEKNAAQCNTVLIQRIGEV
jgi:hypothetical protein